MSPQRQQKVYRELEAAERAYAATHSHNALQKLRQLRTLTLMIETRQQRRRKRK